MKTLGTNSKNDLHIGVDGRLVVLSDLDAVMQNCATAMKAQRAEMIYAMEDGMPFRQTAWDTFNPVQFEAAARMVILAVAGVTDVQSFGMSMNDNILSYTAVIVTTYGLGILNG